MSQLLHLKNVRASYGTAQALFDINLEVEAGEVVALMGRNGMGKSTTIKTICRLLSHTHGVVSFAGQNLSGWPSYKAARLGLGLVPEGRRCFTSLSVKENLLASARPGLWDSARITALFPRLGERLSQSAGTLSGGEQQMLAIGRALMTNPKLLILDEATEGLAPVVRQEIWSVIGRLKNESAVAILLVDKSLSELRQIADSAVVLERGSTVWKGAMSDLGSDIVDHYLGI